jgi:hypothetical protein
MQLLRDRIERRGVDEPMMREAQYLVREGSGGPRPSCARAGRRSREHRSNAGTHGRAA